MFERILVALDGSELSEVSLHYATELAATLESMVDLVYVCEPAETEYRHMHQLYIEKVAQHMKSRIKAYQPGTELPASRVKPVILDGEPAAEILNYAEKNDIGIIVMASYGRSGILPWPWGSTADKILHAAHRPLLLIKPETPVTEKEQGKLLSKILLPLDGSKTGEAALPHVKEIARRIKTEIVLLQVVPLGQYTHTVGGTNYVLFPEQEVQNLQARAKEYLEETAEELKGTKATVMVEVKTGQADQEIIKFAEHEDVRLVAISSHGRSGLKQWMTGSVTHKVLQASHTPVLVVRVLEAKA
ncbi:MAG: universal stress protein [Dehalococcoidales bacterium]|nr:universal stress protein [Dehalococcoidales bacterium]MDZ4230612.1 universal stress protein [Dehalococcoidales bacterium]